MLLNTALKQRNMEVDPVKLKNNFKKVYDKRYHGCFAQTSLQHVHCFLSREIMKQQYID